MKRHFIGRVPRQRKGDKVYDGLAGDWAACNDDLAGRLQGDDGSGIGAA